MTDALVEAGGKAISNAIDPNTGDPIGVTIHTSDGFAYGDGDTDQQLAAVHTTCRAAFTAALQAIEAAGYRVVPVEATRAMRLAGEKEMMARHTNLDCFRDPYVDSTYAAMLSAAPRVGEG